ncbi:MAG: XRE family transcriptional regulator, partial [Mesorhizobium sp.]
AWLEEIRRASDHTNPSLTSKGRSAIRGIFGK